MFIKIDEQNRVRIKSTGAAADGMTVDNVTTFIVDEPQELLKGILHFDPNTRSFYAIPHNISEEYKEAAKARTEAMATARKQKADALKWLADNDWKVNKRMLGEWAETDERWLAYLEGRARARADIDDADAVLNTLK